LDWHNIANALARYVIGFPGAELAAYGLREQAFRFIAPLDAPPIVATLRVPASRCSYMLCSVA